jgi:PAS domain S-box-containing protein
VLRELVEVSLTGVIFYRPVVDAAGAIVDFVFDYLNPAAQRMMSMPARPTLTHREQWPHSEQQGTFAFHVDAFVSGEPRAFNINYQFDGYDNYYRLAARRSGNGLLMSFTDTADQPRTGVEIALRQAQAREQAARTDAERQRQQLHEVLHQAPVAMALLEGPEFRIALANPAVREIWARSEEELLGQPLLQALPELEGQGVDDLLGGVLRSGEPFFGTELPFEVRRRGRLETIYFNFVYQPQRDARGEPTGVLVVASDVTAVVLARQRVEEQEQQTAALNEEIRANNDELTRSQRELRRLNAELEGRIHARTQDLQRARVLAEGQKQRLERLFQQAPAAICILTGPDMVYELVNPAYQQLFPGRQLQGRPLLEALPEVADQAAWHTLLEVYRTGVSHHEARLLLQVAPHEDAPLQDFYFDNVQQARYDERGRIDGVGFSPSTSRPKCWPSACWRSGKRPSASWPTTPRPCSGSPTRPGSAPTSTGPSTPSPGKRGKRAWAWAGPWPSTRTTPGRRVMRS